MTDQPDLTLDEVRALLAPCLAANAAFDGWGDTARDMAADEAGVDADIARLAFSGGAVTMIDAWFMSIDAAMLAAWPAERVQALKIRQRIAVLVEARLDALAPNREALRRARTVLALPHNLSAAARLGWRTADVIWRQAGDTAADYNHYTKRTLLLGIYAATMTVFLDDESEGQAESRAFLARRIENIMQFEKAKAGFLERTRHRPSLARFVGRLRYPVR